MKLLKSTLMASALVLGTASMSIAQNNSYGSGTKAKDIAVDKAKDVAKDKAKDMVGDKAGMVDPAMKAGEHMMKGDSAKDAMMKEGASMMKDKAKSYGSGTKAEDAMMKEGASMMKDKAKSYGSGTKAEDSMMKEGASMMKDKAMSHGSGATAGEKGHSMMKKGDAMMKDTMHHQGTIKSSAPSYGSATSAAPAATINCPAGTTAQANGTCMITGNYQPRR